MEYNGEGIHALVCALDDMQNSNLIFVDQRLKTVLKCLAYYPEFRTVFARCNQNFDYEGEKRKALGKIGNTNVLRLPKNQKYLVALVSRMLVDFDAGNMDIVAFAGEFFPQDTKQDSFNELFIRLIEPFKYAVVKFVTEGFDDEAKVVERKIEFATDGIKQRTEYLLVNIINQVQETEALDQDRDEYLMMLEGFASALDSRDSLMIRSIWIGLKKALEMKALCKAEIEKVDEILKIYLVIK